MRISLMMCTLGRRDEIAAFVESLLRQPAELVAGCELIIVDQNVDDRLAPIVARYADRVRIEHVRMTGTGLSRARNVGLRRARGALISFPDDDCEYLDGTLERVVALFGREHDVDVITGHPTDERRAVLPADLVGARSTLDRFGVLNRCQEFTIFARSAAIGDVRFNEEMGVGAKTPWGADEGPDFLIRLVDRGARVVYFPRLFVYHPNKTGRVTRQTLARAASYARGRGCLFRLHGFPIRDVARGTLRPLAGVGVYLALLQPMRAAYYATVVANVTRGLLMRRRDATRLRAGSRDPIEPIALPPLPARPLVSVLIANFNYARFLPETLDGLIAQTYERWEAVVCDDGSTDGSAAIVRRHAARDARIRLVEKPNGGQTSTVNECYRHLRGEVVCLLDADDRFASTKLECVVDAFRERSDAGLCAHFAEVIDGDGDRVGEVTMNSRLDDGWLGDSAFARGGCVYVPVTSCMSFRRAVLDALMPIPAEQRRDVDGYLGMGAQFLAPFVRIDKRLADYRIHGSNMGGLTEPTPARLRYELTLIRERTTTLCRFVSDRFGAAAAARLSTESNPQFIQAALKLLAIGDADDRAFVDARVGPLIAAHPSCSWRAIWRAIFATPHAVRCHLVPMLHRSHRLKSIAHALLTRRRPTRSADANSMNGATLAGAAR